MLVVFFFASFPGRKSGVTDAACVLSMQHTRRIRNVELSLYNR